MQFGHTIIINTILATTYSYHLKKIIIFIMRKWHVAGGKEIIKKLKIAVEKDVRRRRRSEVFFPFNQLLLSTNGHKSSNVYHHNYYFY